MPHKYDPNYSPPFPVLPVVLHNSNNGKSVSREMAYLDTGADSTLVPHTLLEEIGAKPIDTNYIQRQGGERRPISIHSIDIEVDGEYLSAIEVVGDKVGTEILLGNNVLNRLAILLDGVKNETTVLSQRPQRF